MNKEVVKKQPKSKGKAFLVISVILGIASICAGLFLFFFGAYFRGILYFIVALFAFLPKKITRVSYAIRFSIVIGALIILYFVGQVSLYTINHNYINNNMQENFTYTTGSTHFSMIIYNTTETKSLLVGNQTRTTEGYFLSVNCGITNLGKDSSSMSPSNYALLDNQNNTYQGLGFSGDNEYFQPSLEKDAYFIFEIPKAAQGLRIVLEDSVGVHVISLDR